MSSELVLWRSDQRREDPTETEAMLWKHLLDQPDLAAHFRREVPLVGYVVDFYAGRWALAVEVDGSSHAGREKADHRRDAALARAGVVTARFTADDIEQRVAWVISTIRQIIGGIDERKSGRITRRKAQRARDDVTSDEERGLQRAQREASDLWKRLRLEAKFPRFTDAAALRSVKYAVERVWGEVQWRDIDTAIREHAAMEFSKSPWMLDEWARQAKLTREARVVRSLPVDDQLAAMRAARR